jgi:REP element-mobilizing transposase RayT
MRYDNFIPQPRFVQIHSRGRLPHWQVDEAIYFVTFSLSDALPAGVAKSMFEERERMMRTTVTAQERARLDRALELRLDQYLDRDYGSCILRDHGGLVAGALKHFDGDRYQLHAWCVMPSHVHAMFYLERGADLPKVLHSWKSWTSHKIDMGNVWQPEYFDRMIRSPRDFCETQAYIRANPGKAGLHDWPWVG